MLSSRDSGIRCGRRHFGPRCGLPAGRSHRDDARADRHPGLQRRLHDHGTVRRRTTRRTGGRSSTPTSPVRSTLIQAVLAGMRRAGGGNIVIIASEWGVIGWPQATAYSASEAGTDRAHEDVGSRAGAENITVNAVAPGVTDTPQLQVDADNAKVSLVRHARRNAAAAYQSAGSGSRTRSPQRWRFWPARILAPLSVRRSRSTEAATRCRA